MRNPYYFGLLNKVPPRFTIGGQRSVESLFPNKPAIVLLTERGCTVRRKKNQFLLNGVNGASLMAMDIKRNQLETVSLRWN